MLRKLLYVLGGLLVVLAVTLAVLWLYIDRVAAVAIEEGVERAGGVPCSLGGIRISLLAGSVGVDELAIGNPPGYPRADMFRLQRADVKVRTRSLWNQPVHIERLEIIEPVVRVEAGQGGSNVRVFLANVQGKAGAERPAPPPEQAPAGAEERPGEPARFVVDHLLLKDATVRIGSGITSAELISVTLPTVELRDVCGKDGRGVTAGELAARIVYELLREGAVKRNLDFDKVVPPELAGGMEKITKTAGELIKKTIETIRSPLETLLGPGTRPAGGR